MNEIYKHIVFKILLEEMIFTLINRSEDIKNIRY
jgi:hypothetical protein